MHRFSIIVHGGAGSLAELNRVTIARKRNVLMKSVNNGFTVLKEGGSALDSVEIAINYLEDSAEFNAGCGSCFAINGKISMDAGIMDGKKLDNGAVGCVSDVKNPISFARAIMERTDHTLVVGPEADKLAKTFRLKKLRYIDITDRTRRFNQLLLNFKTGALPQWEKNFGLLKSKMAYALSIGGTVGSVAIDKGGNLAAGVSTGGRWLKLPGRVGDSAVIGSGFYADNRGGAACATGNGEDIMRICLSKAAVDLMKKGMNAQRAASISIELLTNERGAETGGIITVDRTGLVGYASNTRNMPIAKMQIGMKKPLFAGF